MKINEDATDGKAHAGVLQSNTDYAGKLAKDGKTPPFARLHLLQTDWGPA